MIKLLLKKPPDAGLPGRTRQSSSASQQQLAGQMPHLMLRAQNLLRLRMSSILVRSLAGSGKHLL
jgi:hypothetical protein